VPDEFTNTRKTILKHSVSSQNNQQLMLVYVADQQQYTSAGEKVEGAGGGIRK